MSEIATAFGNRVRQLRQAQGMSQEELSFKAGISAAHLGQIERAVKKPTVDTIGKLAEALNVEAAELFLDRPAASNAQTATRNKIDALLSSMDDGEQKDVLRILRILKRFGTDE